MEGALLNAWQMKWALYLSKTHAIFLAVLALGAALILRFNLWLLILTIIVK